MLEMESLDCQTCSGVPVFVRVDFNVPMVSRRAQRFGDDTPGEALPRSRARAAARAWCGHRTTAAPRGNRIPSTPCGRWRRNSRSCSDSRSHSQMTASARRPAKRWPGWATATSVCSRICAFTAAKKGTTRLLPGSWPRSPRPTWPMPRQRPTARTRQGGRGRTVPRRVRTLWCARRGALQPLASAGETVRGAARRRQDRRQDRHAGEPAAQVGHPDDRRRHGKYFSGGAGPRSAGLPGRKRGGGARARIARAGGPPGGRSDPARGSVVADDLANPPDIRTVHPSAVPAGRGRDAAGDRQAFAARSPARSCLERSWGVGSRRSMRTRAVAAALPNAGFTVCGGGETGRGAQEGVIDRSASPRRRRCVEPGGRISRVAVLERP